MTTRSKHVQAAALALACAVACWGAGAFELRLGPGLATQPWRLWTAHLVHASPIHFLLDVGAGVVLIALGAPLLSYLWLAPVVALGVAATRPDLATYVGLSGVLHGWFVLAVLRTARPGFARAALLLTVLIKVALELHAATTSLGGLDLGAVPVAEAHMIGVLAALVAAAIVNFRSGRARAPRVVDVRR